MPSFYSFRLILYFQGVFLLLSISPFGEAKFIGSSHELKDSQVLPDGLDQPQVVMPAMVRKAGGSWRPELRELKSKVNAGDDETKKISTEDDDWHDSFENEPGCPRRMYYHIRGKRCVQLRCNGGNRMRNRETGECMEAMNSSSGQGTWNSFGKNAGHNRYHPAVFRSVGFYTTPRHFTRG